jgi:origin recognition complex subunit 2
LFDLIQGSKTMPPRKRRQTHAVHIIDDDVLKDSDDSDYDEVDEHIKNRNHRRKGARSRTKSNHISTFFKTHHQHRSNKTVGDLDLSFTEDDSLKDIIASLPTRHGVEKVTLHRRQEKKFGEWYDHLRQGASILLTGFGSKASLLDSFAQSLNDGVCITVNGNHSAAVNGRSVLLHAVATLKNIKSSRNNFASKPNAALLNTIDSATSASYPLYIIIHSIDAPGFHDDASQSALAALAALPHVHLAASVDHVYSSILWNLHHKDAFSWLMYNVTNFETYTKEVMQRGIPSLLLARTEEKNKHSATVVLATLQHTAREVFRLIADLQMDSSTRGTTTNNSGGVTATRLLSLCRQRFLLSNQQTLNDFLKEFKDHDLVQIKRSSDGTEVLHIPMNDDALEKVLDNMESAADALL